MTKKNNGWLIHEDGQSFVGVVVNVVVAMMICDVVWYGGD